MKASVVWNQFLRSSVYSGTCQRNAPGTDLAAGRVGDVLLRLEPNAVQRLFALPENENLKLPPMFTLEVRPDQTKWSRTIFVRCSLCSVLFVHSELRLSVD